MKKAPNRSQGRYSARCPDRKFPHEVNHQIWEKTHSWLEKRWRLQTEKLDENPVPNSLMDPVPNRVPPFSLGFHRCDLDLPATTDRPILGLVGSPDRSALRSDVRRSSPVVLPCSVP